MATYIILAALVLLCAAAGYRYVKRLRSGSCCGGGGETPEKRVKVEDKNKAHYPYLATLKIDGMICSACARRVENALNRLDGVWAQVDLERREANVRMKQEPDEKKLRDTVLAAGYTVMSVRRGA